MSSNIIFCHCKGVKGKPWLLGSLFFLECRCFSTTPWDFYPCLWIYTHSFCQFHHDNDSFPIRVLYKKAGNFAKETFSRNARVSKEKQIFAFLLLCTLLMGYVLFVWTWEPLGARMGNRSCEDRSRFAGYRLKGLGFESLTWPRFHPD